MNPVFKSIDPSSLSTLDLRSLLLPSISPRPIALASTIDESGKVNLSPFSYFNLFSINPPVLIFSPAKHRLDNTHKHSYMNVKKVPEVVINMVSYDMAEKMILTSGEFQEGINEFDKAGFTEIASQTVRPPRVQESPISFECSVSQVIELGEQAGAGNLVICSIKKIHIQEAFIGLDGLPDATQLDLVSQVTDHLYCRSHGEALFKMNSLTIFNGIGVDQLSQSIRNSNILSQNQLAKLGNAERLPTADEIKQAKAEQNVKELFLEFETRRDMIKDGLHRLGIELLEKGKTQDSLATLMIVDEI